MKVIALSAGFYNGSRVREGAEFEVADGQKAKWFAPVEAVKAVAAKAKVEKAKSDAVKTAEVPLSKLGGAPPKSQIEVLKGDADLA
jgi:16S rRNA U1498 N3-methylase RsmE